MHLLLVEDEYKLSTYLKRGLTESGFCVDVEPNGLNALTVAREGSYDAIILDAMLPGMDGFEIVKNLREARVAIPILMLTARDSLEDRVKGLENGADDYLVKPFNFSELVARVRALLRRSALQEVTRYTLADLELDVTTRRAQRAGRRLDLTAKELALLSLLMRRHGQIIPRAVLIDQVWGVNFDTESNVVEVTIRRLRSKMDDSHAVKLLHTVRGMGYVLEDRGSEG
jgi:two-component system copper resistance phosphate regulon response regulator CusR